jgi:hypothetical protein
VTGPIITAHAVSRYRERVAAVSYDEAVAAMDTPFVRRAIEIGACSVKLATGQRLVLHEGRIVTVLEKGYPTQRLGAKS